MYSDERSIITHCQSGAVKLSVPYFLLYGCNAFTGYLDVYVRHRCLLLFVAVIVVSDRYRRKGISESLMNEFFNRMKSEQAKFVTTGFFRPEYFYRFGFKIERKYSGLEKEL